MPTTSSCPTRPPDEGVRGKETYHATWPPLFRWQASGAVFEIESLVDDRLRLTLGLRKSDDRWVVAHEHHRSPTGRTATQMSRTDSP